MKKLVTVLLALAMAFTMVFATAASAEDGYKDSITWVIGNDQDILDPQNRRSLRLPFGNLRIAHPCFLIYIVTWGNEKYTN